MKRKFEIALVAFFAVFSIGFILNHQIAQAKYGQSGLYTTPQSVRGITRTKTKLENYLLLNTKLIEDYCTS